MDATILKELANDNIHLIFDAFELDYIDKYNYYQMICPIHDGADNPTAFSWVKDGGYFRCFTRHCERGGADIFDFVRKYKKCSFKQAFDIVKSIIIDGTYEQNQDLEEEIKFRRYIRNASKPIKKFRFVNPEVLKRLEPHDYLVNRGFDKSLLEEYNVGYCANRRSYFYGRICIPLLHDDGGVVGFTARAVGEDWKTRGEAKWVHSPECPTGHVLFNLFQAKKSIRQTNKAILVEGPLDVFKFRMAGIDNVVAVLGSNLSGPQRSLLLKYECYDLYLAFDNDTSGKDCASKIKQTCGMYFQLYEYQVPEGKDIGDLSVEEIKDLDIIRV